MAENHSPFHETIGSVNALVRTVGAGLVAYVAYVNATSSSSDSTWLLPGTFNQDSVWANLLIAAVIGMVGYAIYMSVFETLFMHAVLRVLRWSKGQRLPLNGVITNRQLIRVLFRERASRYESDDKKVKALQNQLEFFYSWLVFLYCTALLLVCAACLSWYKGQESGSVILLFALAFLSWLLGLFSDVQLTRQELWLLQHCPQWEAHKNDTELSSNIQKTRRLVSEDSGVDGGVGDTDTGSKGDENK